MLAEAHTPHRFHLSFKRVPVEEYPIAGRRAASAAAPRDREAENGEQHECEDRLHLVLIIVTGNPDVHDKRADLTAQGHSEHWTSRACVSDVFTP
jgi:hypothetical protein